VSVRDEQAAPSAKPISNAHFHRVGTRQGSAKSDYRPVEARTCSRSAFLAADWSIVSVSLCGPNPARALDRGAGRFLFDLIDGFFLTNSPAAAR